MMNHQKGYVLVVKAPSRRSTLKQWLSLAAAQIARWKTLRCERSHLAALSDDALKDIGLSRADVYQESERPFWHDPMKH